MEVIDIDDPKYNDLAKAILVITRAMKTDFGQQYFKHFPTDGDMKDYRRRLYTKLKHKDLHDIKTSYESWVDAGNKFCPNIPELLELIDEAAKERRRRENNAAEALRIGNTPKPTIECKPLEMLRKAQEVFTEPVETPEERKARRAKMLDGRETLLNAHKDKIQHRYADSDHKCHIAYCDKPGSMSHGTTGKGNFYCPEHFKQMG